MTFEGERSKVKLKKQMGIMGISAAMLLSAMPVAGAMSLPAPNSVTAVPATPSEMIVAKELGVSVSEAPVDTKISRERAIELAKQYIPVPEDYTLQSVNYQNMRYVVSSGAGAWSIHFVKQDQRRHYGNINVTVDAETGKLQSFYSHEDTSGKQASYPPKVDLEEAKQISQDMIEKLNPELKGQLQYYEAQEQPIRKPLTGNMHYPVRFARVANGIVFPQNFVTVTVDGDGKVVSYQVQWDTSLSFKAPDQPISSAKADELFKKQSDIQLRYIFAGNGLGKSEPLVTYYMEPMFLDAKTGEATLLNGMKPNDASKWIPASEKPLPSNTAAGKKLTKEQAVERVQSIVKLPSDAKLEDASYYENVDQATGKTSAVWDLRWTVGSGDKPEKPTIHAGVDSSTGALLRYSKYDYRVTAEAADTKNQETSAELSYDKLQAKAIEHVKALQPAYAHELFLQPKSTEEAMQSKLPHMQGYPFYFKRIVAGVQTEYEFLNLQLDPKTGDIVEYYSNLTNFSYPAETPKVISKDEAASILLDQYRVELQYVLDYKANPGSPFYGMAIPMEKYNVLVASGEIVPGDGSSKPETKLVYQLVPKYEFRQPAVLDAKTGEWKSREDGQIVRPITALPADIIGHWAEDALTLMFDYQALDVTDGQVKPDEGITRGEMVKMLLAAVNGGYMPVSAGMYADRKASFSDVSNDNKYFAYIENAIDRNLIDRTAGEFKPEGILTRQELASMLVRGLGYQNLAKVEGLFNQKATDLDGVANQGDIALVTGLSMMSLDNGKFVPLGEMTRAQAATAFYKFLQARASLQSQPGYGMYY
jgi:hypothetical protein